MNDKNNKIISTSWIQYRETPYPDIGWKYWFERTFHILIILTRIQTNSTNYVPVMSIEQSVLWKFWLSIDSDESRPLSTAFNRLCIFVRARHRKACSTWLVKVKLVHWTEGILTDWRIRAKYVLECDSLQFIRQWIVRNKQDTEISTHI